MATVTRGRSAALPDPAEARPGRVPWRSAALDLSLAAAVAAALALWDSRFHVVPTLAGGEWRGISDPPGAARLAWSAAGGIAFSWATRQAPGRWRLPLVALGLAAAPLLPVYSGWGTALLALQGPVLSFLLAAAVAVSAARAVGGRAAGRVPAVLLFAAPFAFYAALAPRIPGAAGFQGDEPHYLAMAHSLWTDGDLDLTDEFERGEYAAFFPGRLAPHPSPSTPPGRLYSLHAPGLALLILPGYALLGPRGAQLVLCGLAALAAVLVHRAARTMAGERVAAAAWALFAFAPPLPIYAVSLYPELPAALATAVLLAAMTAGRGWGPALAAAVAAGAAPWLHSKFLPLGLVGLAFTLVRPYAWRVRAAAMAVYALLVGALLFYFHATYGSASFSAAFGPPDLDLRRLPWGVGALLLDRQFGLMTFSPVWLLALPGAAWLLRRHTGAALGALALVSVPLAVGGVFTMWWGGASPPARFLVPALPALALLAAPAAVARKELAAALAAVGLVLIGLAADAPRILHNRPDGQSLLFRNLSPVVDLDLFLPSFFERGPATPLLALTLVAACALAWRARGRGLVLGGLAYVLVAAGLSDRPLVDARLAAEDVVDKWDPDTWAGPMGPPNPRAIAIPIELQRGPWTIGPGEFRNSRRTGLPPGAYRVELRAASVEGPFRMEVDVYAGDLPLGRATLTEAQPGAVFPLLLPGGGRQIGLTASGASGRAVLAEARVVPEALVPRRRRGEFPLPLFAREDRYRRGDDVVRATAVDRTAPEGDGFRLEGPVGLFLVDGHAAASARVEVRRAASADGGEIVWAGRTVRLPPGGEVVVDLPLSEGLDLGRASVVPVEVRSPGGWVRFRGATAVP